MSPTFPQTPAQTRNLMTPELTEAELEARRIALELELEKTKKESFLAQYKICVGLLSFVCRATGVTAKEYRKWMRDDPEFKESIEDLDGGVIDTVEAQLLTKIKGGDLRAITFYLRTKGKKRGYTTQVEQEKNDLGVTDSENVMTINLEEMKHELPPQSVAKMIEYLIPIEDASNKSATRFPNRDNDSGAKGFGERSNPTRFAWARVSASDAGVVEEGED